MLRVGKQAECFMDASSDLIVDVARAADPERASAMAQRLAGLDPASVSSPPSFSSAVSAAAASTNRTAASAAGFGGALINSASTEAARIKGARQQFEATLLNSFVSEMMPQDATSSYGGGYAGDMWRSLLAQKMSDEIAKSGVLGIASRVFDNGHSPALAKLESAAKAEDQVGAVTATSSNELSLPPEAEASEGAVLFANRQAT